MPPRTATSREELISTPRSGARPLFRDEPVPSRRIPPAPSARRSSSSSAPPAAPAAAARSRPRSPKPRAVPASSSLSGQAVAARRATSSAGRAPAAARPARPAGSTGQRGRAGPRGPAGRQPRQSYGRAARQAAPSPSFRNYQGIVLAEFVAAELLVAMTPIAARPNVPGLSPYIPRDMTKLLAIGLVYFLLELMSIGGGGAGRVAAWLGGLVLLTVGLNEGANVARDLDIFSGKKIKPEPVQEA